MKIILTSISILSLFTLSAIGAGLYEHNKTAQNGKLGKVGITQKFDSDNDGRLSAEEHQNMRQQIDAKRQAVIAKYDENNDGTLSRSEFKAIPKAERRDLCPKTRNPSEQLPMRRRPNRNN